MTPKTKWLTYAVAGLLAFGLGLSLLGESILKKFMQDDFWVAWGTLALIVTNSGLCLFGQAVIEKVKLDRST